MKNRIYKYFFHQFIGYFAVTIFALTAILWTIQAVNFLDLVTDDGHAFRVYILYSFLTIPKIITKLIPFSFLIASMLTIIKFEKDNELIILWTSGLNKIYLVNLIFRISLLIMFVHILMSVFINPETLNISRTLIKNSKLQFISSLLKERTFNASVEGLTVFVDKKLPNNTYEDIFIRDDSRVITKISDSSSTIFAKSGYVKADGKNLVLLNGIIQKVDAKGNVSIIKFDKTQVNLSGLSTKTISETKIQETSTLTIIECMQSKNKTQHNCMNSQKNAMDTKIEINRRFGMPIFIPLLALISCLLLSSRKSEGKISRYYKYICFFIGFIILVSSEITVRYSGISLNHSILYYSIPTCLLPLVYLYLIKKFKYENLH